MDGDGELQHAQKDDLNISVPCATGQGDGRSSSGDDNNNEDNEDDMDNRNSYVGEGDDDEGGDTTDGAPPSQESSGQQTERSVIKRPHIQSQRMKEYQQQLSSQTGPKHARKCEICGQTLYSGPGFRYHQQRHFNVIEKYTCDGCPKVFTSSNGLKYHRKRKRCRGGFQMTTASGTSTTSNATSSRASVSRAPAPQTLGGNNLMVLANVATGPGSPLLGTSEPNNQGRMTTFFNDSDAVAAMTLSNMKKGGSEARKAPQETGSTSSQNIHSKDLHSSEKSKRPMNGFMLFAKANRTELNKKHPDMNNRMISTKLSEHWNNLPAHIKQRWKDEARQRAEQIQKDHPDCWKRRK